MWNALGECVLEMPLENVFEECVFCCRTDCCFSPDDKMVLTGISVRKGHGMGKVVFMDKTNLNRMHELDVAEGEVSMNIEWWQWYKCLFNDRITKNRFIEVLYLAT